MSKPPEHNLLDPAFLRSLEQLALATKKARPGTTKGERRSTRKGASTDFADYRDYVQGDDLRHIDWNIYGRLETLYLKLFMDHEDLNVHILVDCSASMGFGTPWKIHFAQRLAAAIGYIGLSGYDRVSIGLLRGDTAQVLPGQRSKAMANRMFSFLSSAEAEGNTHLEAACRSYLLRQRTPGIVLLISDLFDEQGFEGALRILTGSRSEVYVVQVLAPEEMDPSLSGDLKLVDAETKAFAEISMSRGLLNQYTKNRDAFLGRVQDYCAKRGLAHVLYIFSECGTHGLLS